MFLRDKLCQKKIFAPCLLFCSLLLSLVLCSSPALAASMQVNHFNLSYVPLGGSGYVWSSDLSYDQSPSPAAKKIDGFYTQWAQLTPTGNTMVVHYEVNLVMNQPLAWEYWHGDFVEAGISGLIVGSCDWSNNAVTIVNQSVSTARTYWSTDSTNNQTLTFYVDFVVQGLPSSAGRLHCYIASDYHSDYPFFNSSSEYPPTVYFERSSTTFEFANNVDNTLLQSMVNQNQTIINQNNTMIQNQQAQTDAIDRQTNQSHEDYENEIDRENDKEEELEDQSGDLGLSAQTPSDPWDALFPNVGPTSCRNLTSFSTLFHLSTPLRLCSPYPSDSTFPQVISTFVTTALVYILVVRLYAKHLKGGVNG